METTQKFAFKTVGEITQQAYSGTFTVKTLLTRADQFAADQRRRDLLGSNPQHALDPLKFEAFMRGQLSVRIIDAPKWWKDSNDGNDIEDFNVTKELFDKAIQLEQARIDSLKSETEATLKKLASKDQAEESKSE